MPFGRSPIETFGDWQYSKEDPWMADGTYGPTEIHIQRYTGKDANIVFPDTIEGFPVTVIAERIFFHTEGIESIKFPAELKTIWALFIDGSKTLEEWNSRKK